MTASKIDGNAIARSIRERLGAEVKQKQATNPRYLPALKIVQGKCSQHCSKQPMSQANFCLQSETGQTRVGAPTCSYEQH
jgi:hypothetical protein